MPRGRRPAYKRSTESARLSYAAIGAQAGDRGRRCLLCRIRHWLSQGARSCTIVSTTSIVLHIHAHWWPCTMRHALRARLLTVAPHTEHEPVQKVRLAEGKWRLKSALGVDFSMSRCGIAVRDLDMPARPLQVRSRTRSSSSEQPRTGMRAPRASHSQKHMLCCRR